MGQALTGPVKVQIGRERMTTADSLFSLMLFTEGQSRELLRSCQYLDCKRDLKNLKNSCWLLLPAYRKFQGVETERHCVPLWFSSQDVMTHNTWNGQRIKYEKVVFTLSYWLTALSLNSWLISQKWKCTLHSVLKWSASIKSGHGHKNSSFTTVTKHEVGDGQDLAQNATLSGTDHYVPALWT